MFLVRHAAVVVARTQPPSLWQLSPEGRRAAARLRLPEGRETARLAGLYATPDDRLREVLRPWSDDYEADVRSYLGGATVAGWEPRDDVLARLHTVLDGHDGIA